MTLDRFLADPALALKTPASPAPQHRVRVRFRPASEFARGILFSLPLPIDTRWQNPHARHLLPDRLSVGPCFERQSQSQTYPNRPWRTVMTY